MILVALENTIQRKGLEALIRENGASTKIYGLASSKELLKFFSNNQPSLAYVHSTFIADLKAYNKIDETVRVVRIIDKKPELFNNDNSSFDILYLNDDEQQLTKNIKRNIALSEKQERQENAESNLSEREQDVIREIALGKTNKEIAENLFISAHTVITHRKNITRKLGIKTVSGLTVYAILHKIIQMEEM